MSSPIALKGIGTGWPGSLNCYTLQFGKKGPHFDLWVKRRRGGQPFIIGIYFSVARDREPCLGINFRSSFLYPNGQAERRKWHFIFGGVAED